LTAKPLTRRDRVEKCSKHSISEVEVKRGPPNDLKTTFLGVLNHFKAEFISLRPEINLKDSELEGRKREMKATQHQRGRETKSPPNHVSRLIDP
jgi:hypothetical protein